MIIRLAYQLNGEMKDRQPSVFHIRRLQRRQQQPQHLRKVNAANLKETIVLIRNFILQKVSIIQALYIPPRGVYT